VLVSSTHTTRAGTLGLWGRWPNGHNAGYLQKVRKACVDAVARRIATLGGTLRIGTADVNRQAELIGDSRLPKVIDSQLTAIQAKSDKGRPSSRGQHACIRKSSARRTSS